jgi:hypothetical protein
MEEPLRVVSLDARGRVRRSVLLVPNRLFADGGARWIVELPAARPAPPAGAALRAAAITGRRGCAGIHEADHGRAP